MTSDCAGPEDSVLAAPRRKGLPAPGALAAAAVLHAAILALLLPWPFSPPRPEAARPVPVRLVRALPHHAEKPPQPPVPAALANGSAPPAPPAPPSSAAAAPAAPPDAGATEGAQPPGEAAPRAAQEREAQQLDSAKMPPAKGAPKLAKRRNKPAKRQETAGGGARIPGAAVYGVVLASAGSVDSITLLQSSGRPDFDAAGEQVVRNSLPTSAPRNSGGETRYFTVTLRFSPDRK